jgi:hypothetical protein
MCLICVSTISIAALMAPSDAPDQMPTQSPAQISMKVSGANSSSPLIPANAVAKAGSKCAKAGNTEVVKGKSYTCIKSGKKLAWNKGVVISAKTPNKTTPPMPAGVKAALDNIAQFPKSKETPQALNYNFGPNAEKNISNTIKKNAEVTMQFFVDFYQDTKPYQIFYGSDKDIDWVIAEWRKYGYAEAIGAELFEQSVSNMRRRTGPTSVMVGSDNRLPQTPMILLASRNALLNNNVQINTIHHVVHGVQGRITGGKDLLLGCWGREGAAQFYSWAIMDRNFRTIGGSDYATERRAQSKPEFPWNAPKTNLLKLNESQWLETLKLLEGGQRFGNQIYCNLEQEIGNLAYSSGALLYERLVGEFGHQKVIDWWFEIRSTSDWKVAFEKVFKLDINDWYKQSAIPYLMKEYQAWK